MLLKKNLEKKRIKLEERLMDLIECSQDLEGISTFYFDSEILSILDELEKLAD